MPFTDLHKRKKARNLAVLAAIFAFAALIWAVTVVRISQTP